MTQTIRQRQLLRGRNDLLESAYRNLGRMAFYRDVLVVVLCAAVVVVIWSL